MATESALLNKLKHSRWTMLVPLALLFGGTFSGAVVRDLCLIAAVSIATWIFYDTELAKGFPVYSIQKRRWFTGAAFIIFVLIALTLSWVSDRFENWEARSKELPSLSAAQTAPLSPPAPKEVVPAPVKSSTQIKQYPKINIPKQQEQPKTDGTIPPLIARPSQSGQGERQPPVAVVVEKGATWKSTCDTVFGPDGRAIDNQGTIVSNNLAVNPTNQKSSCTPLDELNMLISSASTLPRSPMAVSGWSDWAAGVLRTYFGEDVANEFSSQADLQAKLDFLQNYRDSHH